MFARLQWEYEGLRFLLRNLRAAWRLPKMPSIATPEVVLSGCSPFELGRLARLHALLREGRTLNFWRLALYALKGESMVAVARLPDGDIVGFDMFYFRQGEVTHRTVHEAFIGTREEWRRRGLATALRLASIQHFQASGLSGISSHIESSNSASLRSAVRAGFEVVAQDSESDSLTLRRNLERAG